MEHLAPQHASPTVRPSTAQPPKVGILRPAPQQSPIQHSPLPVLVGRRQAAWQAIQRRLAQPLIQRDIPNKQYKGTHAGIVSNYANGLDTAVQKAWAAVQKAPLLGSLASYDGHTQLWAEKMEEFDNSGKDPGGLHTSFGYVIESLATGPLKPDAPPGYSVVLQGSRGGTRPDLILRHNQQDVAWLDITASNSANHIFDKEGGWRQVASYAEITYPSVDASDLLKMKNKVASTQDDELALDLNPGKILAEKRAAQLELERKRNEWQRIGQAWLNQVKKISLTKWPNADAKRAKLTKEILQEKLGLDEALDGRTTASILSAMRLNPRTFGFNTGFSVSTATGLSMLQDNDPSEANANRELRQEKKAEREEERKNFKKSKMPSSEENKEKKRDKKSKEIHKRRDEKFAKNRGLTKVVEVMEDEPESDSDD